MTTGISVFACTTGEQFHDTALQTNDPTKYITWSNTGVTKTGTYTCLVKKTAFWQRAMVGDILRIMYEAVEDGKIRKASIDTVITWKQLHYVENENVVENDMYYYALSFDSRNFNMLLTSYAGEDIGIDFYDYRARAGISNITIKAIDTNQPGVHLCNMSPRAFDTFLKVDLPFPMNIKKVKLRMYKLDNHETHHAIAGKIDDGQGYTHNDYYILDSPELQQHTTVVSNNEIVAGHLGVICSQDMGHSRTKVDGFPNATMIGNLSVHNAPNIEYVITNTTHLKSFRIKLLNPDGEPAVMHRASFWFELFYDNTCK
jgi:hypothetical protein